MDTESTTPNVTAAQLPLPMPIRITPDISDTEVLEIRRAIENRCNTVGDDQNTHAAASTFMAKIFEAARASPSLCAFIGRADRGYALAAEDRQRGETILERVRLELLSLKMETRATVRVFFDDNLSLARSCSVGMLCVLAASTSVRTLRLSTSWTGYMTSQHIRLPLDAVFGVIGPQLEGITIYDSRYMRVGDEIFGRENMILRLAALHHESLPNLTRIAITTDSEMHIRALLAAADHHKVPRVIVGGDCIMRIVPPSTLRDLAMTSTSYSIDPYVLHPHLVSLTTHAHRYPPRSWGILAGNCPALVALHVFFPARSTESLEELCESLPLLPSLATLSLKTEDTELPQRCLDHLSRCRNLTSLDLTPTPFNPEPIAALGRIATLRHLRLNTDSSLMVDCKQYSSATPLLSRLHSLALTNGYLKGPQLIELLRNAPRLRELHVKQLYQDLAAVVDAFTGCDDLEVLVLDNIESEHSRYEVLMGLLRAMAAGKLPRLRALHLPEEGCNLRGARPLFDEIHTTRQRQARDRETWQRFSDHILHSQEQRVRGLGTRCAAKVPPRARPLPLPTAMRLPARVLRLISEHTGPEENVPFTLENDHWKIVSILGMRYNTWLVGRTEPLEDMA